MARHLSSSNASRDDFERRRIYEISGALLSVSRNCNDDGTNQPLGPEKQTTADFEREKAIDHQTDSETPEHRLIEQAAMQ